MSWKHCAENQLRSASTVVGVVDESDSSVKTIKTPYYPLKFGSLDGAELIGGLIGAPTTPSTLKLATRALGLVG